MYGVLRFDGGARPTNPGHAGFGLVVETVSGKHELSRYLGHKTNNYAEYSGLIVGVKFAFFVGVRELEIISDSKLVVCQVNGEWQVREDSLKQLCRMAQDVLTQYFTKDGEVLWSLKWEKRASNADADQLCTDAIYHGMNRNPFTPASIKAKRPKGRVIDPFSRPGKEFPRVRVGN